MEENNVILEDTVKEILVKILGYEEKKADDYIKTKTIILRPSKKFIELPEKLGTVILENGNIVLESKVQADVVKTFPNMRRRLSI